MSGSWYINNTGFITGRTSVISIDACSTEQRTRTLLDRIASVTSAPVTTLVNTHHHGDHTYGNSAFGAVTIVGHENCRTELIAAGPPANRGPLRNCLAGSHVRPAQGVYGSRKEADRFLPPHQLRKCAIREGKAMPVVPYYLARPANVWITAISLRNSARQEGGERADG